MLHSGTVDDTTTRFCIKMSDRSPVQYLKNIKASFHISQQLDAGHATECLST